MDNNQMINILNLLLGVMISILIILCIIFIILKIKSSKPKKIQQQKKDEKKSITKGTQHTTTQSYNKESIFNFMEFDKIEDNMIVQKDGKRFLMVIECQGINYA